MLSILPGMYSTLMVFFSNGSNLMLFEELNAGDFLSDSPGTTTTNVSGFEFLY
jgi:hypothetical protein